MALHLEELQYLYLDLRPRQPHHLQSLHAKKAFTCPFLPSLFVKRFKIRKNISK